MGIGVGVIGFGGWAQRHALFYREAEDADLLAISAPSERSRRRAEELFNVDTYANYRDLLARGDIEAVSVVVPNNLHAKITIEALRAGKHVLVEKPMALSTADCREMIKAAREENRKLAVGHELRLNPLMEKIREIIDDGRIGEARACFIDIWRPPWRGGSGGWRYRKEVCGGIIFEEPVHYIDLFYWYMGMPEEVYAVANRSSGIFDFEDSLSLSMRHRRGGMSALSFSMAGFGYDFSIRIAGTEGAIKGTVIGGHYLWSPEAEERRLLFKPKDGEIEEINLPERIGELYDLKREIELWIECIREDKPPIVPGETGMIAVAVCEAAEKAISTGKPARIPPIHI